MKNNSTTKTLLTVLFTSCFLISNILAAKQFQFPFGITMTGAIIVFPVTYILSDVFSEVYGYKWSRITCYMAFAMNLLMVIAFEIAIRTPAPIYWENQEAFKTVLGSSTRILGASLTAFIIGDFVNDRVFKAMKQNKDGIDGFALRAIVSSIAGEICDSVVFIPLAFIGQMPMRNMVIMGITQVSLKVAYEIIILPVTKLVAKKVNEIEENNGKSRAKA